MNIFITGNPGCGKSTLVKRLLQDMTGKKIAGIITPEIREGGVRQGFKIIDLASGKEEILAATNIERGPGVSKYKVNVSGIEAIMDAFLESFDGAEYVVIDEIGMMEFYSRKFRETIEMVLNSGKAVIATLSKRFVRDFEGRGRIYYLTRENIDEIYSEIKGFLEG